MADNLGLLRWVGTQGIAGLVSDVPKALAKVLAGLGIDASMYRDLVWNWQRYFGRSYCAGRLESMNAGCRGDGSAMAPQPSVGSGRLDQLIDAIDQQLTSEKRTGTKGVKKWMAPFPALRRW